MEGQLVSILSKNLGKYKVNGNGWYSFNCPNCSFLAGKEYDGKFNLECHVSNGEYYYHCWSCSETHGTKGDLIKLVRLFPRDDYDQYVSIIKNYVDYSRLYQQGYIHHKHKVITYPKGCKLYDNRCMNFAQKYLLDRGLTEEMIMKFNIVYTTQDGITPSKYWDRIVIPSFDMNGMLNYIITRSYNPNNPIKYLNCDADKKEIVFNEYHIDYSKDIVLVEGVFDHFVVPNSIPLLGKVLTSDMLIYKHILEYAKGNIIIFLDGDAYTSALKIYKLLNSSIRLMGRVKMVVTDDNSLDPSDIYRLKGEQGINDMLMKADFINEYELLRI